MYKVIIEADSEEMAYVIGLEIVDKLGIKPTKIQFENEEPIPWDTVETIRKVKGQ